MSDIYDANFYDDKTLSSSQPLKNLRFGYQNRVSTVTASSSEAGFEVSALENPFTYEIWKPSSFPATVTADLGAAYNVDYVAFAAHEFADCELVISTSTDNVNFTEVTRAVILDDDAIMLLFDLILARYVRVSITGWAQSSTFFSSFETKTYSEAAYSSTDTGGASCSVMYVGAALAMDAPCEYVGHKPGNLNFETKYTNNESEGGQWLGRSIVRNNLGTSYNFSNIDPFWFRTNVQPFIESVRSNPFFVLWRPDKFGNEAVYARTMGDINPDNGGPNDFMSFTVDLKGYSNS